MVARRVRISRFVGCGGVSHQSQSGVNGSDRSSVHQPILSGIAKPILNTAPPPPTLQVFVKSLFGVIASWLGLN